MNVNALIKTHHITSRKKVAALRKAADKLGVYALLRSGKPPGLMYVEGSEDGVRAWVDTVRRLRYKDYQLLCRPAPMMHDDPKPILPTSLGLSEVATIKEFSAALDQRSLLTWWKKAAGFAPS